MNCRRPDGPPGKPAFPALNTVVGPVGRPVQKFRPPPKNRAAHPCVMDLHKRHGPVLAQVSASSLCPAICSPPTVQLGKRSN